MADAIDAAIDQPEQPADAFLRACSALLMAIANNCCIDEGEEMILLDAMPNEAFREGLRVGLGEMGVLGSSYVRTLR